jgi:hypothetical protein
MNDYLIYDLAKQRHADLMLEALREVHRSRTIRFRNLRAGWTRVTASARQRFAVVAHVLTNRTRIPSAH